MITYIYTLDDPITHIPKYVGKTHQNPKRRFSQHISSELHNKSKKATWIKSLKNKGLKPILTILDQTEDSDWEWLERYWISQLKSWGFQLKNLTEGGDGNKGQTFSKESIEKRRQKLIGRIVSQEVRDKISKAHLGKKLSNVTKEKLRNCNLGKIYTEKTKSKKYKILLQIDENNNLIKEHKSMKAGYEYINCPKGTMSTAIHQCKLLKGCYWKYKQDIV